MQNIDNSDIILDQYKMLRAENMSLVDETRKIEIQVLAAIAVFYPWLLVHPDINQNVWYLASLLVFFGGLRALGLFIRLGDIRKYMIKIEKSWKPEDEETLVGWETYFKKPKNCRFPLSYLTIGFWILLLVGTFFAPCVLRSGDDPKKEPIKVQLVNPPSDTDAPKGQ